MTDKDIKSIETIKKLVGLGYKFDGYKSNAIRLKNDLSVSVHFDSTLDVIIPILIKALESEAEND